MTTPRQPHLVALGDLLLDVVVAPARPVERGTDVPGRISFRRGGSAANGVPACIGCHGRSVHARASSSVRSCAELRATVARFAGIQGRNWDAEDQDDVTTWLNVRYYGFPVLNGLCGAPMAGARAHRATAR